MISRRAIEDGRLDPASGQLEQERLGIDHLGQTPGPRADATIEGPQAGLRSHRTGRHARPVDRAHHYHLRGRARPPTKLHPDGTDRALGVGRAQHGQLHRESVPARGRRPGGYPTYGREGIDRLSTTPVDLVITDWNMPEMSGIEFVKAVRANDATKKLPVLMVTTNAAEDDIKEALRAGVNNYVVKPFTPDTIKDKIASAIGA